MLSLVSSIFFAILFVAGSFAAPTALEPRAIDADLLAKFNLIEQYAAAAYCPSNNNSPGNKITCSSGNCPLVDASNAQTVIEFENSLLTDVTGYVATDPTHRLIVVAFRGSQSLRNWLANLNFPAVPADVCAGCTAEGGFWSSWTEARAGVLAAVKAAAAANPGYGIAVTGHSLGGAIAAFAAAQLRNDGYKDVALYTFGAPRIGGAKISEYISNQPGGTYRVTHLNDPVPHLPPVPLGFVHISPEYYISSKNYVPVTAGAISVYPGSFTLRGNTGQLFLDADAHGWYFNDISACYPDDITEFKRSDVLA